MEWMFKVADLFKWSNNIQKQRGDIQTFLFEDLEVCGVCLHAGNTGQRSDTHVPGGQLLKSFQDVSSLQQTHRSSVWGFFFVFFCCWLTVFLDHSQPGRKRSSLRCPLLLTSSRKTPHPLALLPWRWAFSKLFPKVTQGLHFLYTSYVQECSPPGPY